MGEPKSKGLFRRILKMEFVSRVKISKQLNDYNMLIEELIELGTEVVTIKGKSNAPINLVVAGLFLKRILKDMRCIRELLEMGYSAQAACIAASLFENSLVIIISARDVERAKLVWESKGDSEKDIPWKVIKMCEMSALRDSVNLDSDRLRYKTLCDYISYKWLCRLKHPTLASAFHDASSTRINEDSYSVLPIPDSREEDLSHKVMIAEICITKLFFAIKEIADALDIKVLSEENPQAKVWMEAMITFHEKWSALSHKQNIEMQFSIKGTELHREWEDLRKKLEK